MKIQRMTVTASEASIWMRNELSKRGLTIDDFEIVSALDGISEFNRVVEAIEDIKRSLPGYKTTQKIEAIQRLRRISGLNNRPVMSLVSAKNMIEFLA